MARHRYLLHLNCMAVSENILGDGLKPSWNFLLLIRNWLPIFPYHTDPLEWVIFILTPKNANRAEPCLFSCFLWECECLIQLWFVSWFVYQSSKRLKLLSCYYLKNYNLVMAMSERRNGGSDCSSVRMLFRLKFSVCLLLERVRDIVGSRLIARCGPDRTCRCGPCATSWIEAVALGVGLVQR